MNTMEEHLQALGKGGEKGKFDKKFYNTTDLDPKFTFEKHVLHRDFQSHAMRWSFIFKEAKIGESIVDFGCGEGNLLEVLYRNRKQQVSYVGLDIREQTIKKAQEYFKVVPWAKFIAQDLIKPTVDLKTLQGDKVCSFEVAEHVGKQNIDIFLTNFRDCGKETATYYLSTPNYDERVGAAGNHTYDSGDGRGVAVQEFAHSELQGHLEKYFEVVKKFGTFASVRDYKHLMNEHQRYVYDLLHEYYDANYMSNIMAPMFPEQSRNTLWVLRRKQ